jgi:integrase
VKYASVYPREGSPRFRISYFCVRRQKRVHETSPFLVTDPQGRRKALALAFQKSKAASADLSLGGAERWERWVEVFLLERYKNAEKTSARMIGAWHQWQAFLHAQGIRTPRGLDYNSVLGFVAWRRAQIKPSSHKAVSKNTALCDVRVMSVIMREAMRRGFAETNHCEKLGIQKDPAKQKPEMTEAEIELIRAALVKQPAWMQTCFEIALHQGCRLTETSVPLSAIDADCRTITFAAKGRKGVKHVFTTQLHPALVPLIQRIRREGATVTCELPQMAAKEWHFFFKGLNLGHLCFHCTRVTVITRMARAGVPISQAMAFVGHASETIHRVYQRLATTDLARAVAALDYSPASGTKQTRGGR